MELRKSHETKGSNKRRSVGRLCGIVGAFFLALSSLAFAREGASAPEFDRSTWRDDGFPLLPNRDADAFRSIWTTLESTPDLSPFAKAVTQQLIKQGKLYKGKLLSVEGRLLRAERKALPNDERYYDVWILLPDSKTYPVRLITRQAPEGFETDQNALPERAGDPNVEYRHETLRATAVYYRTTAYDAGVDFLAAPTLVAESFSIVSDDDAQTAQESRTGGWLARCAALLAVVAAWFLLRRLTKKNRRGGRGVGSATVVVLALAFAIPTATLADEHDGAEFWGKLAGITAEEWRVETSADRPRLDGGTPESARRRAATLAILGIPDRLLSDDVLAERAKNGDVETVRGTLQALEKVALSPIEEERVGTETIYRAVVALDGGERAALYLTNLPTFTAPKSFFDQPREAAETPGIGERVAALGVKFGTESDEAKTFLATRLKWTPTSAPLGRAGIDLAAFEEVPVFPHDALEKAATKEERERVARAMRWTTADRRAFYGALAGYSDAKTAPRDKREPVGVVSLFNEPERNQGARVALDGWVRRVNMILVSDPEIRTATGLERYYQLFLFTSDSQGWPVVLCVPELPEGLEPGGGDKYRREVSFDGFFYKTWAYKSSAKDATSPEEESEPRAEDQGAVRKWTRAPVAVGRLTSVKPLEEEVAPPWSPSQLFVGFAILAGAWIVLRRVAGAQSRKTAFSLDAGRRAK